MSLIDDTDSLFNYQGGTWLLQSSTSTFNDTLHVTDTPGAFLAFGPFIASSIAVFGTIGPNQPTAHYVIDDMDNGEMDFRNESSTSEPKQLLFQSNGLDATAQHNLKINVLDPGTYSVDFISLNGALADSPPTVPSSPTTSSSSSAPSEVPPVQKTGSVEQTDKTSSSQSVIQDDKTLPAQLSTAAILVTQTETQLTATETILFPSFTPIVLPSTSFLSKVVSSPRASPVMKNPTESQGTDPVSPNFVSSGHVKMIVGTVIGILVFVGALAGLLLCLHHRRGPLFNPSGIKRSLLQLINRFNLKSSPASIDPFPLQPETSSMRVVSPNNQVIDIREHSAIVPNGAIRSYSLNSAGGVALTEKRLLEVVLSANDTLDPDSSISLSFGGHDSTSTSDVSHARHSLGSVDPPSYETFEA